MPFGINRISGGAVPPRIWSLARDSQSLEQPLLFHRRVAEETLKPASPVTRRVCPGGGGGVAARLGMGHAVGVTRAVRRFRDDPKSAARLKALEARLGIR